MGHATKVWAGLAMAVAAAAAGARWDPDTEKGCAERIEAAGVCVEICRRVDGSTAGDEICRIKVEAGPHRSYGGRMLRIPLRGPHPARLWAGCTGIEPWNGARREGWALEEWRPGSGTGEASETRRRTHAIGRVAGRSWYEGPVERIPGSEIWTAGSIRQPLSGVLEAMRGGLQAREGQVMIEVVRKGVRAGGGGRWTRTLERQEAHALAEWIGADACPPITD